MRVGFIGLGRMGSGLAKNLLKAGYSLHVYDINQQALEEGLGNEDAAAIYKLVQQHKKQKE